MKIDIATILLASVFALGNGTGYARTAEDALKTRPKEDNRAAVDAIAKQAAGAWVSNGEVRGKVVFEDLVKDEASVAARWNMTKGQVLVTGEERGGKCVRLVPNGKTFINFTQKKSAFIPYRKGEPIALLWEARTPEGGSSPYFRYDTYDASYKHVSATEFRSVVDPTEPQTFHRNAFVFTPSQDGYFMIFFHLNPSDTKPAEVANIRACELKDVIEGALGEGVDVRIEREKAGGKVLWYVSDNLSSSYPVMPVGTRVHGKAGETLRIRECPGEKTRASVVLWSKEEKRKVAAVFSRLENPENGAAIPAAAVSAKIVKCHYQGMGAPFGDCMTGDGQVLVPELLLNDESLVIADHERARNFVRYSYGGESRYVDINSISNRPWGAYIPEKDMPIADAPSLCPFDLEAGLNKQLALRFSIPEDAKPGVYKGTMDVKSGRETLARIPLAVEVLPFRLPENAETSYDPEKNYTMGLYTWTRLNAKDDKGAMGPFHRSLAQVEKVYSMLYDNGIRNPAFIWHNGIVYDEKEFRRYLSVVKKVGFKNPLVLGSSGHIGNYTNETDIAKMQERIKKAMSVAKEYGFDDVYFYGFDEAYGARLLSQRKAWKAAKEAGAKIVVSGGNGHFENVGDLLDLCIYHEAPENAKPSDWHSVGHRIWKYGTPQTGAEDPRLFRRNYGLYLWSLGFDGANTYCEMDADGVWNDLASTQKMRAAGRTGGCYRSHSILYPSLDGAIETIAFTGLESAIKDVRYMTLLRRILRKNPNAEARKWLDSIDYSSADPAEIRRRTIDWILKCSAKKEECRELFNGGFSLKNAAVSFSPDVFYPGWRMKSAVCDLKRKNGGACGWKISDGEEKGAYGFSGSSSFSPNGENGFDASFVYEAVKDIKVKHVFVGASFGVENYAGGKVVADGAGTDLPAKHKAQSVLMRKVSKLTFFKNDGQEAFSLRFDVPVRVFIQDNRYSGGNTFGLRIFAGDADSEVKKGERLSLKMSVSVPLALERKAIKEVTVKAGEDWIPVDPRFDVKEGGPLDLSGVRKTGVPAGKYGRVVVRNGHFEFENLPGERQKFYGINLCFGANFPKKDVAPAIAKNLAMVGYNSVRVHHHDEQMTKGRDGSLDPEAMELFDSLMAACISNGLYVTTDLFVSRRVPFKDCGIDCEGKIEMGEFKELVMFHEGVFSNYLRCARAFLGHVNPHTRRRYADEPALGWLSLVNEGNLGNFDMRWMSKHSGVVTPQWVAWLGEKAKEDERYAAIPKTLPSSIRPSGRSDSAHAAAFVSFLADVETKFARRVKGFLRDEMKCKALTTNMNCWHYPVAFQVPRAEEYDYVDDHFYIDHPSFLDQKWRLPSRCPNVNPFTGENKGAMAPLARRIFGRPFTVTEFNYSSPGRYRGVGGIATGTMAALQDWDGIWRFAWSHGEKGMEEPAHLSYFNVSSDPLALAAERAVICLYLREDVKPLCAKAALHVKPSVEKAFKEKGNNVPLKHNKFGWLSQIGCVVGEEMPEGFARLGETLIPGGKNPVRIDGDSGKFEIDTAMTAGGFGESGTVETGVFRAEISQSPCAVWVSSLDSRPVEKSFRLLLTHLTDVQNTGMKFADESFTVLKSWGRLPHLMRRGKAAVSVKLDGGSFEVWSLDSTGVRRERIPAKYKEGRLEFVCDTARDASNATFLYEIVKK